MINLGDKQISDIKLGSTNVVSVYQGDTLIWPPSPRGPYTLVYTTTSTNQSVRLTYSKEYFEYIETEDGIEDLSGSGILNHTFVNPGEHEVKVLFKKGLTDLNSCFYNCLGLTSIPSDLFANNPEVTNFACCFQNCAGLTSIPNGLFANNPEVTKFNSCFYYCTKLTSIPNELFTNNPEVTNFACCFYNCLGLTSIPNELFTNNTKVVNFASCFYACTGLTSIPNGLFANNPEVTNFASCFQDCNGLTSIPNGLFANNTKVINFNSCFYYCTKLTSPTPIDNDGTPLYNRSSGKEGYSIVTSPQGCFKGCTLMSDYDSIPSNWINFAEQ